MNSLCSTSHLKLKARKRFYLKDFISALCYDFIFLVSNSNCSVAVTSWSVPLFSRPNSMGI